MKRLLVITALVLSGCSDDQSRQHAMCKLEAMKLWPTEDATDAMRLPGEPGVRWRGAFTFNHIDDYMMTCMQTHGYTFSIAPDECTPFRQFQMQPACYESSTQRWLRAKWSWVKEHFANVNQDNR
jgi:hypothetical protein